MMKMAHRLAQEIPWLQWHRAVRYDRRQCVRVQQMQRWMVKYVGMRSSGYVRRPKAHIFFFFPCQGDISHHTLLLSHELTCNDTRICCSLSQCMWARSWKGTTETHGEKKDPRRPMIANCLRNLAPTSIRPRLRSRNAMSHSWEN